MKIVIWVVWLELQIKRGWACLECWYWECLFLRCNCICIVKPCLYRKRKSFYSFVRTENAFWCNVRVFTFSASLPLNECLWITFAVSQQVHAHVLVSGLFAWPGKKKKKKFPSRTQVFETRVLWKIEGKKFPQWNSSLWNSSSIGEIFSPQCSV